MKPTPIRRAALVLAPLASVALLSACSSLGLSSARSDTFFGVFTPYRVDVVQGNVVTQEVMAQIQPGLGRLQVREILGTPLLADPFHLDRWDYVFTIQRQGVPDQKRRISIFFKDDVVERFDTDALPSEREFVASIDKPVNAAEPLLELPPEQQAKLPVPARTDAARKLPQGAVRDYPPLERGQR
ncbi:MAG: outer membrane protein assembly factor BamE [Proteobacteria bacterium]|uniref:outer membrane protein assembly factor BamE n=1 Tax=Aquabacterium sp. TaxID=1872578 RepID=UPI0035C70BBB|nr:outer membrane protein assembly factor BamE [Pseudomonadota bacterium]